MQHIVADASIMLVLKIANKQLNFSDYLSAVRRNPECLIHKKGTCGPLFRFGTARLASLRSGLDNLTGTIEITQVEHALNTMLLELFASDMAAGTRIAEQQTFPFPELRQTML